MDRRTDTEPCQHLITEIRTGSAISGQAMTRAPDGAPSTGRGEYCSLPGRRGHAPSAGAGQISGRRKHTVNGASTAIAAASRAVGCSGNFVFGDAEFLAHAVENHGEYVPPQSVKVVTAFLADLDQMSVHKRLDVIRDRRLRHREGPLERSASKFVGSGHLGDNAPSYRIR